MVKESEKRFKDCVGRRPDTVCPKSLLEGETAHPRTSCYSTLKSKYIMPRWFCNGSKGKKEGVGGGSGYGCGVKGATGDRRELTPEQNASTVRD